MARRKFTREFKLSAVQLVNHQGYSIPEAARSLGVDPFGEHAKQRLMLWRGATCRGREIFRGTFIQPTDCSISHEHNGDQPII